MATPENLRATYGGNGPPSDGLQAAIPQTAQHSERIAPQTGSSRRTTLPQCSNQPTNPTAVPDCKHSPPAGPYAPT